MEAMMAGLLRVFPIDRYALRCVLILSFLLATMIPGYANCPTCFTFMANDACPTINTQMPWQDFITRPDLPHGVFGVRFPYAKAVNDPAAMGNLDRGACYSARFTHSYYGNGFSEGWDSYTLYDYDDPLNKGMWPKFLGLPGDPMKYEINVGGVTLLYSPAGEVFDHKGKLIGELVCYIRNDCAQYR